MLAGAAFPDPDRLTVTTEQARLETPFEPFEMRLAVLLPSAIYGRIPATSASMNPTRRRLVQFVVVVGAQHDPEGQSRFDYLEYIDQIHDAAYDELQGKPLNLDDPCPECRDDDPDREDHHRHRCVLPIWLEPESMQDTPAYDPELDAWFMAALYRTVLDRVQCCPPEAA